MIFNNDNRRALYSSTIFDFIASSATGIIGQLHNNYNGVALTTTNEAWQSEIEILQNVLGEMRSLLTDTDRIIFEYNIPRLGKRIDVVLLIRGLIICLEFKAGEKNKLQTDIEQVMDYALDLKNFHQLSHMHAIIPILIPTEYGGATDVFSASVYEDSVYNVIICGKSKLRHTLQSVIEDAEHKGYLMANEASWEISPYKPTPTIVEAARTLYANHSVDDITKHDADAAQTDATISTILKIIECSKLAKEKSICFVTGVPGAGKTLVGLDVAVKQTYKDGELDIENGAVYLSGNGPLVAVLTAALARDNYNKCREKGERKNLSDCRREVSKFIQIIHRYRDNMLAKIKNPIENGELEIDEKLAIKQELSGYGEVEHVAIFDEAQRSWTHDRIANYLKRGGTYGNKLKVANFPMSEAEFLIWSLDQREDWAVIICLVGGGQEINTGEAGISEWIKAVNGRFKNWKVYISPELTEKEYAEGNIQSLLDKNSNVTYSKDLHLSVSMRSFRAETLSKFVHSLLSNGEDTAELYEEICNKGYPFLMTRNIEKAREWLRAKSRGSERTGILISKVAARFKPLAVNILAQGDDNAVHWFLEDKTDVRSSDYLEDAATEIQVQGLELDYACVLWDADMRWEYGEWGFYKFNGKDKWNPEKNAENQKYMLNAYRVLLTRARQGLIICIPEGNPKLKGNGFYEDPTRLPAFYDGLYDYLKLIGVKEI